MKKLIPLLFFIALLLLQTISAQPDRGVGNRTNNSSSEKRLALVIGNSAYKHTSPLVNPTNDANDMTAALKSLGFEVVSGTNQSKRGMEMLIREFGDKLARQGGVGLFFYAGHGLQVNGNNYLVPIEADIPEQDEVEYATVNLGLLLGKMASARNDLNIVILDACRNNPFARSWRNFRDLGDGKGLAKITPPTGTMMLYATQPGNVASDGTGRNGLFTESLLQQIKKPNIEFDAMVKLLARDVSSKSSGKQIPWKEGIVLGDFYFAGSGNSQANQTASNTASNNQPTYTPPTNPTTSYLNPRAGMTLERPIGNGLSMKFMGIPSGSFVMGSPKSERYRNEVEIPQRTIRINIGFWMSRYEVTQEEYQAVMGTNPSHFSGCPKCPVEQVSWNDAKEYIKRLNAKNDGYIYSLPSEAEWEYAARAGTTTRFAFGESLSSSQANINGEGKYLMKTTEVGSYQPNSWGLYDMHGNVEEWCEDIWKENYSNLSGDSSANITIGDSNERVVRGGSWYHLSSESTSTFRGSLTPDTSNYSILGFRLVARSR